MYFQTRLPNNFYLVFLKMLVLVLIFVFLTDFELYISIPVGLILGLVGHVWSSYYDCYVTLDKSKIKFNFIRPIMAVEEFDLSIMDDLKIIKENTSQIEKDMWRLANFHYAPYRYETLVVTRDNVTCEVKFRTNHNDLKKLNKMIEKMKTSPNIAQASLGVL